VSDPLPPADAPAVGWRAQVVIGAALFVIAALIAFDATLLTVPTVVGVGPTAAMRLIAILVALVAAAHWVSAWRQRARERAGASAPAAPSYGNRAALGWVLGALIGLIAIIEIGGGFVLASTWLFAGTARGFGQRLSAKSFAIGFTLAALVYLFFTKALSLGLPAGPLERLVG
jgi:putative tricarboxylic transport membrane protein